MFKHVLVPVDESDLALRVAGRALRFSKALSAEVTCVHVIVRTMLRPFGAGAIFDRTDDSDDVDAGSERIRAVLSEIAIQAKSIGVEFNQAVVHSDHVFSGILETAREISADVIYMASHGRSGVASILLGSESQKVLAHADIAVLLDH